MKSSSRSASPPHSNPVPRGPLHTLPRAPVPSRCPLLSSDTAPRHAVSSPPRTGGSSVMGYTFRSYFVDADGALEPVSSVAPAGAARGDLNLSHLAGHTVRTA